LNSPPPPFLADSPDAPHPSVLAGELLEALSAGPDQKILLAVENKSVMAAALLAAAAGGPGVVLPHALTDRVLRAAAEATGATRVLTDRHRALPTDLEEVRFVPDPNCKNKAPPLPAGDPARRCLWLFTGGSTGRPSLWSKTAANLFEEARLLAHTFAIGQDDCILATVPIHHIYGLLFSVILPLVAGARTANSVPYFPEEIRARMNEIQTTMLISSPAHFKAMASAPPRSEALRLAFSSGGFLAEDDGVRFLKATEVGVTEVYGSTETGGIATRRRFGEEIAWTPMAPIRWRLEGELLAVNSPFLSPDLPVSSDDYFTTGDRVTVAEAGLFNLLGRADGVFKVGGKRVEVESTRARLLTLPGIDDVAMVALPSDHGRKTLLAALVVGDSDPAMIRRDIGTVLEPHETPRIIRHVDEIPRSPNGKEDREAVLSLISGATTTEENV
jgi:acyl-coenzyme A synthetase/AMP-(fatty) acid ligase